MANLLIDSILANWKHNQDYANRLLADLSDEQMVLQPQPNMNHPAWTFSHINAYHPVLVGMLSGGEPEDPLHHPFGQKSGPLPDASLYGAKASIVDAFNRGHEEVAAALQSGGETALERAMPIERWQTRFPKVGNILAYLMLVHESTHLGQISAWRRVQGLPSV